MEIKILKHLTTLIYIIQYIRLLLKSETARQVKKLKTYFGRLFHKHTLIF